MWDRLFRKYLFKNEQMDSKILALLVIGVASIVVIAAIVAYQFAQEQYAVYKISENLKNLEIQKEKAEEQKRMGEINSQDFPQYEKCYNEWVTNSNETLDFENFAKLSYEEKIKLIGCEYLLS
jgi:hypothetical protein